MTKTEYRKTASDMIYLTKCAIRGKKPDTGRVAEMDMEALFEVCQSHSLTACVGYALSSVGAETDNFCQARNKAIRKNILLDAERNKIFRRLDDEKIRHMAMKGAILKDWYPKLGMRQMSDNDILCDGDFREKIKEIMLEMGYNVDHYGGESEDAYFKEPVFNFEVHSKLFQHYRIMKITEYYYNVGERLVKCDGKDYEYRFTPEDFYIYMIAHEYKHYSGGGTGVRSLLDIYIFMEKFAGDIDKKYMSAEFEKLGIADFEKNMRELAVDIFGRQKLRKNELEMLDYLVFSGTYGNEENAVKNAVEMGYSGSKAGYLLRKVFPPMDKIKIMYPFFYSHKYLIPVLLIYRPIKLMITSRNRVLTEIKYLFDRK